MGQPLHVHHPVDPHLTQQLTVRRQLDQQRLAIKHRKQRSRFRIEGQRRDIVVQPLNRLSLDIGPVVIERQRIDMGRSLMHPPAMPPDGIKMKIMNTRCSTQQQKDHGKQKLLHIWLPTAERRSVRPLPVP